MVLKLLVVKMYLSFLQKKMQEFSPCNIYVSYKSFQPDILQYIYRIFHYETHISQ